MSQAIPEYLWPQVELNQEKLIAKFQAYLAFKRKRIRASNKDKQQIKIELDNCVLPYNTPEGLCSGLTAYWLYLKRDGFEGKFIHMIEYLSTWDESRVTSDSAEDPIVERLLNAIAFLQFDYALRDAEITKQEDLVTSFNLIQERYAEPIRQEFDMSFVFDQTNLSQWLKDFVEPNPNKMIYFNNINHAMGLMYSDGFYYLYNSSDKNGAVKYGNAADVTKAMFQGYTRFSANKNYLSLYAAFFDQNDCEMGNYPDKLKYLQNILRKPAYAKEVLHQADLLHLLVKHQELQVLNFLIQSGMRVDYKSNNNSTLAGLAIENRNYELLYLLLHNGVNLDQLHNGMSIWNFAAFSKNPEALTLLLAFGYSPPEDLGLFSVYIPQDVKEHIFNTAITLHKEFLNPPDVIDLSHNNGHDIVMFLRHHKLLLQLGRSKPLIVVLNGAQFKGFAALQALATYYHTPSNADLFDFAQKAEIYNLLKFFKADAFKFHGSKDLVTLLSKLERNITSRDFKSYSIQELIEIGVIITELDEIIDRPAGFNPQKNYLHYKAKHAKNTINGYLKKNGISCIQDYIAQLKNPFIQRNYMFFTPDKDKPGTDISAEEVQYILRQGLTL